MRAPSRKRPQGFPTTDMLLVAFNDLQRGWSCFGRLITPCHLGYGFKKPRVAETTTTSRPEAENMASILRRLMSCVVKADPDFALECRACHKRAYYGEMRLRRMKKENYVCQVEGSLLGLPVSILVGVLYSTSSSLSPSPDGIAVWSDLCV